MESEPYRAEFNIRENELNIDFQIKLITFDAHIN